MSQNSGLVDASIVIPAFNEHDNIVTTLQRLNTVTSMRFEVLIVVDSVTDSTVEPVKNFEERFHLIECVVQDVSPGPAGALKYGMSKASSDYVIVMMADGSDEVRDIPQMVNLLQGGATIVCASRYMKGGSQIGGGLIKRSLSRLAGQLLYSFARTGTHDATNSFKGYSKTFIEKIEIESTKGFEMGIELVSKASRCREPIAEFPTHWQDRTAGTSNFRLIQWIGAYLKWFFKAFGPSIDMNKLSRK